MTLSFPKGFRFGWSQAGFQHEMGIPGDEDTNSDWWVWVHDRDNIVSGLVSGDLPENGPGYWSLYRVFHDNAVRMGLDIARVNVEWSRIFPKPMPEPPNGNVEVVGDKVIKVDVDERDLRRLDETANKAAIEHYRAIFNDLKNRNIFFILNLYHWPLPLWVHDPIRVRKGDLSGPTGWLDIKTVINFARFAAYVAWKLDDLVDMYSTMNEPNVVAWNGYINVKSGFPPSYLNPDLARKALVNLIQAHARAYDAIKTVSRKPVGIIYANNAYTPLTEKDSKAVELAEQDARWSFFDAVIHGNLYGEVREDLRNRLDWIGANYYSRLVVKLISDNSYAIVPGYGHACERNSVSPDNRPCSDFGWEFYPEGLYDVLTKYWRRYHLPIYVTENGIADSADYLRPYYLVSHIYQVYRALSDGVDVRGYLHWSLTDNYEWASGFSMRFGLLYVDYTTKRQYWRPSAYIYREIALNKAIPDELMHLNTIPPVRSLRK
ncbi:beta-galactosidase BgaS [Vulcanisaeta distributa]|uniref:Glycoside hydrolase family 1 n=1 Tax=Vulcanisaeta distributa (strain DSM 14429 / JCM 11212 / NBRC 100878 / IC-017) TaxID=572478 RepID=E1QTH3_VULDI|nr:beta-galactosidase BgaS [Vulcanisaeta distributa]ADN50966.1 glycoside hydrolase family 1 [Vulcanisaeta distributa DSM 14429]